ncbi:hypothetical protein FRC06_006057 [Ceratobasidium sp. 370]|nr:hypothetical protein FRC06_006057 [Ceratobasidium sp. 370]
MPDDYTNKPESLNNLGNYYRTRYQHLGELADIDAAIECHNRANQFTSNDHPDKPTHLTSLGSSYELRYTRLGNIPDLDTAIGLSHLAVSLSSDDDPRKPEYLSNLGNAYSYQYDHSGNLTDLYMAMECHHQAVSLTPDGHTRKPGHLTNLGGTYSLLYKRLGQLADLDTSITYHSQALHITPNGHVDKPVILNNLGLSYHGRFGRLGQIPDLDTATNFEREAVLLTPDEHPEKPMYLSNLGNSHYTRYKRLGEHIDMELAFSFYRQALLVTPDGHPDKPGRMSNMGISYCGRYEQSGELSDLNLAIWHFQQAISLLPGDHLDAHSYHNNLGNAYYTRYRSVATPGDLDLAIDCFRLATSCAPDDHSDRAEILATLGRYLAIRYHDLRDATDVAQSIERHKQAAHSAGSDPRARIQAAYQWAQTSTLEKRKSSLDAYRYFISLIPQVVWLGMAIEQRYGEATKVAEVTLVAATTAALFSEHKAALEWLEQGRSIVWNQLLQLRSPLDELRLVRPELAKELTGIANELQAAAALRPPIAGVTDEQHSNEFVAQRHRRLAERWESLVNQIQSLPGMNHILAPKVASQLVMAAQTRAIVVVVVSRDFSACCALVLRPKATEFDEIWLPNISYGKAARARDQLQREPSSAARGDRKFIVDTKSDNRSHWVLNMLWTDVAKPVLDFLEYTEILPSSELPHITWCTTGPLSFLPLHAAGDYTKSHCSLLDYCISSYTPTLSALLAPPVDPAEFSGITMVGQESTPGLPPLPGTTKELYCITKQAKGFQNIMLDGESATCKSVLDAMERHSWVHLACHATQNVANPIASAFHLHDGPLDLATITEKQFKHADLAFLSACQTATGDWELSEEAIHLAAGMIMAGYRTVIATMWPINDKDAPLVADRFYEYMLKDGVPDSRKAARALHYAVSCLREQVGVETYKR